MIGIDDTSWTPYSVPQNEYAREDVNVTFWINTDRKCDTGMVSLPCERRCVLLRSVHSEITFHIPAIMNNNFSEVINIQSSLTLDI